MQFISPSRGRLSFDAMFEEMVDYMRSHPEADYRVIIGTDSQDQDNTCFVTAVIIHRKGKGGRYFYRRTWQEKIRSLRQKVFYETSLSVGLAARIHERLADSGLEDLNVEVHLDVGQNGATRYFIREVVSMVVGSGFNAKIKPDSYAASTVADRYTK